ncbi:hypothetical protein BDV93DRAFT_564759 [Ceratobasidium sp. AG-I]|nr:hypothetical protein BDV93DRAFT_564759 [Ceratobasidium sp. AG-I]
MSNPMSASTKLVFQASNPTTPVTSTFPPPLISAAPPAKLHLTSGASLFSRFQVRHYEGCVAPISVPAKLVFQAPNPTTPVTPTFLPPLVSALFPQRSYISPRRLPCFSLRAPRQRVPLAYTHTLYPMYYSSLESHHTRNIKLSPSTHFSSVPPAQLYLASVPPFFLASIYAPTKIAAMSTPISAPTQLVFQVSNPIQLELQPAMLRASGPYFFYSASFSDAPKLIVGNFTLLFYLHPRFYKPPRTYSMAETLLDVNDMVAAAVMRRQAMLQEQEEQSNQLPNFQDLMEGDEYGRSRSQGGIGDENGTSASRRHPRSPSPDTPDQRGQKYMRFTEDICNKLSLRSGRRSLVQDYCKLDVHEKLIVSFAFAHRLEGDKSSDTVQAYTASGAFKDHTCTILKAAILGPNNKSYVNGLATFFEDDLVRNHELYKVPRIVIEDNDSRATLVTCIRSKLTTYRNLVKEQLDNAVEAGYCINKFMEAVAPKTMEITDGHRARWAWIINQYKEDKEQTRQAPESTKSGAFWKRLDNTIAKFEADLARSQPDKRERDIIRGIAYETAHTTYTTKYPTQIPARDVRHAPAWQVTLEYNLDKYHSF